jgi:mono/diheme cytochrome c family protein
MSDLPALPSEPARRTAGGRLRAICFRLAVAGFVGAAGCGLLDSNTAPPPVDGPPTAAFGEELFARECQRCHGPEGRGGDVYEFAIVGCQNVAAATIEGPGAMPDFPEFTDDARRALQLYLDSLDTVYHLGCP